MTASKITFLLATFANVINSRRFKRCFLILHAHGQAKWYILLLWDAKFIAD